MVNFGLRDQALLFKQNSGMTQNQVDVLWVVDNSGSMDPLQNNLTSNFSTFISIFQSKGYDFHSAVTTTDAYLAGQTFKNNPLLSQFRDGTDATSHTGIFVILPTTPNINNTFVINASQGSGGSGDERAFSSMREALSNRLNGGFLRPQSFLAVIILSDEDDFSGANRPEYSWTNTGGIADHDYTASTLDSVNSYVSYLDQLTGTTGASRRYNVSAITVLDSVCQQQHAQQSASTIIGQRYIQLVQATNGVLGSICDQSYAGALDAIKTQIAELSTQFFLNVMPQISTIAVQVNGVTIPQDPTNGWTFNSTALSIVFHGSAIPSQNAVVGINFTPATARH